MVADRPQAELCGKSISSYQGLVTGKEGVVLTNDESNLNGKPEGASLNFVNVNIGFNKEDLSISGGLKLPFGLEVHGSFGVKDGPNIGGGGSHTSSTGEIGGFDLSAKPGGVTILGLAVTAAVVTYQYDLIPPILSSLSTSN